MAAQSGQNTVKLKPLRFRKASTMNKWYGRQYWGFFSYTEEDIMYLPLRLAWKDIDDVLVFATKKVHVGVDGKSVEAVSKTVRITDSFWKTVLRLWIPCVSLWIFVIYNTRGLLRTWHFTLPPAVRDYLSAWPRPDGFWFMLFLLFILFLFKCTSQDRGVRQASCGNSA